MKVVGVEEVAKEWASREPEPTLEVREEHYAFTGLGFRLNLTPWKSAFDLRRDSVCPI